jgi:NAD(P)-dependent dehydrogenase (short-subunit alcohol dehydrogenase family)
VIIKGANSGIGFEDAKYFAQKGADVIVAVRNALKGKEAMKKLCEVSEKLTGVTYDFTDA